MEKQKRRRSLSGLSSVPEAQFAVAQLLACEREDRLLRVGMTAEEQRIDTRARLSGSSSSFDPPIADDGSVVGGDGGGGGMSCPVGDERIAGAISSAALTLAEERQVRLSALGMTVAEQREDTRAQLDAPASTILDAVSSAALSLAAERTKKRLCLPKPDFIGSSSVASDAADSSSSSSSSSSDGGDASHGIFASSSAAAAAPDGGGGGVSSSLRHARRHRGRGGDAMGGSRFKFSRSNSLCMQLANVELSGRMPGSLGGRLKGKVLASLRRREPSCSTFTTPLLPSVARFSRSPVCVPSLFAAGLEDGTLLYGTASNGTDGVVWEEDCVRSIKAHGDSIFDVAWFRGTSSRVVTAASDWFLRVWDVETAAMRYQCTGHSSTVKSVGVRHHDSVVFASGGRDGNAIIWDTRCNGRKGVGSVAHALKPVKKLTNIHGRRHRAPGMPPAASSSPSSSAAQRRRRHHHRQHPGPPPPPPPPPSSSSSSRRRTGFSASSAGGSSGRGGGSSRGRSRASRTGPRAGRKRPGRALFQAPEAKSQVTAVSWLTDDVTLLTGGDLDGQVKVWDTRYATKVPLLCLPDYPEGARRYGVTSVDVSPVGDEFLVCSMDNHIYRYSSIDPGGGEVACHSVNVNSFYVRACYNACGKYIMCGSSKKKVYVWDTEEEGDSPSPLLVLRGHIGEVHTVDMPLDRLDMLISCSEDNTIKLWAAKGYAEARRSCATPSRTSGSQSPYKKWHSQESPSPSPQMTRRPAFAVPRSRKRGRQVSLYKYFQSVDHSTEEMESSSEVSDFTG